MVVRSSQHDLGGGAESRLKEYDVLEQDDDEDDED